MIRINLLTEKRKKKAKGPQNLLLSLFVANVAALLIAGGATLWLHSGIARLKEQSEANKAAIAKLSTKINEIRKLEKLNKELEARGKLIESLRNTQSIPVRVLDEVNMLVPDAVWLTSLVFRDNGISLEGVAFSNIDVVSFIDNLKNSSVLTDTYLEESREAAEQAAPKKSRMMDALEQEGKEREAKSAEKPRIYHFKVSFRVKV
ncbi:MAG: PilN domain-containing protein [Nitrospirae bacterium]|nr:PilN domain-containing protein [Nitrospirota bacterium]